jgi:hypothetical protein
MTNHNADDVVKSKTVNLIAGSKVNGTTVYNSDGESCGSISDLMIDKISGKVVYAVMSFGGFLGMGENYHPLPWEVLHYDEGLGGYVVNVSKDQLEAGPTYGLMETPAWSTGYGSTIDDYYGAHNL